MKRTLFTALVLGMASASYAASYQAQGCGLGSTLFDDGSSLMHQVFGATTNGTSGNQTFGMTSGTSNCELDGASGSAKAVFIEANKVAIANDIARGNGETLASLGELYGCSNINAFGSALQKNYETIFPSSQVTTGQIDNTISTVIASEKACI